MIPHNQLSLNEVCEKCEEKFENDKPAFLTMLTDAIHFDEIVAPSFWLHFHRGIGRSREYPLEGFLWALLIQRIFSIPTIALLIIFLRYSRELREFCGFTKVPDASKFTRFKEDFLPDLQLFFDHLVELTEPICQALDTAKAAMTIFDTSGIEAYVTENNPKYTNKIIKQLKSYKKFKGLNDSYDPYKAAYGAMPPHAAANPAIQQMHINGHFCYAFKFGIITNGLGIVRDITFYNQDFLKAHPDIVITKKSDSPDEDKSLADSKALLPVLKDFFAKHPLINPKTFLGDSAFDTIAIYAGLFHDLKFEKAYIPLKNKLALPDSDCPLNEDGIPCCPKDHTLPMKRETGKSHLRCGLPTMKFVCPKMRWGKKDGRYQRLCYCNNPCSDSSCGRMFYIYPEKNLRAYPGTLRGSEEWIVSYKVRTVVEKSINHFKNCFCLEDCKTRNEKTLHADLLFAGISQLLTVLVADKIHSHQFIRSLKPLVA